MTKPYPKLHNKYHSTAPPDAKYIGRGSPHGNPYVIGRHGTREQVCAQFAENTLPTLDLEPLRGYDLVCFCVPQQCHGVDIMRVLYGPEWTNTNSG